MKDFWTHLAVQAAVAAGTAVVCVIAHTDYSSLGASAGMIQAGAAILAEAWNQFFPAKA